MKKLSMEEQKLLIDKINEYREILNRKVTEDIYAEETLKISEEIDALVVSYYQSNT